MHTRKKKLVVAVRAANFYRIHGSAVYDKGFWERQALAPQRAGAERVLQQVVYTVAYLHNMMRTRSTETGWYDFDEEVSRIGERVQLMELKVLLLHQYFHQMGLVSWRDLKKYTIEARKRVYQEHWALIRTAGG